MAEADASEGCNADSEHHEGEFSGPSKEGMDINWLECKFCVGCLIRKEENWVMFHFVYQLKKHLTLAARLKEKQEGRKDKERVQPKILGSTILSNGGDAMNEVPTNSNAGKKTRKRNGVVIKTNISRQLQEPAICKKLWVSLSN